MKFRFTGDKRDAMPAASPPEPSTLTKFMDLPVEIHHRIVAEFLKDLDTTFDEIKALRLVCSRFNAIVKARVYSSRIKLFRGPDYKHLSSNLRQLLTLLSSKPNEQLHTTKTLFIGHWGWLHEKNGYIHFHEASTIVCAVLMNVGIAVIYYLVVPIVNPRVLPKRVAKTTLRAFAKLKLYLPLSQFNLPNVSCIVWQPGTDDPKSIISRIVKLLQQLPRLDGLSLIINESSKRFDHLVNCVSKLHNLRKLSFKFYHDDSFGSWSHTFCDPRINAVSKIIAANPNLTHLEVMHSPMVDDLGIDLAQMLRHIPADRPLKLEHFHLSHSFRNSEALAPHIRSLTSTDLPDSEILEELLEQCVFPPTLTLKIIGQYAIEYLDRHPQIISLTTFYACREFFTFMGILSRHSDTLTHLGLSHWVFFDCIDQTENKLALLRCRNLKRLDLYYRSIMDTVTALELEMETVLSVISRLPDSLTLVINEAWACEVCSTFCGRSQDPLLRDLARRIVCEPVPLNNILL